MKAFKIAATAALCLLVFAAGVAAECLALARYTVLSPMFYGKGEDGAYELAGKVIVKRLSDEVLENVPAIALRTDDRNRAYDLASEALPPQKIAQMLEGSGPYVAMFILEGGDVPVLQGSENLQDETTAAIKNLVMSDLSGQVTQTPSLAAFMPFTPDWNAQYGQSLTQSLAIPRYYARLEGYALAAACAAAVVLLGLLYLLWIRERKPFFHLTGSLLLFNGFLLLALAAVVSYGSGAIANDAAKLTPLTGAASLFAADWPALVRAVLWPFRTIFFVSSVASLSLGVALFFVGIANAEPMPLFLGFRQPARHRRPWTSKPEPKQEENMVLEPILLNEVEEVQEVIREPKHKKKGKS